ncbi:MAG: NADH-quinone oxidoreductase subunit C [Gammaproteobacteria bacterium WSBS_2016_MAG_OTU1]
MRVVNRAIAVQKQRKSDRIESMTVLGDMLQKHFGESDTFDIGDTLGELCMQIPAVDLLPTMQMLRDNEDFGFAQLIDIAGLDYADYGGRQSKRKRFAVVYHLLSLKNNTRLRVRAFCEEDDFPQMSSVCKVWSAADWFEREAFDLFGIVFHGHNDLRRILTDYGFVGHPFRKDFPISGHVEMRYDPEKKRVIYVPVSIAPREVTPRIVREESFAKERDNS